MSQTDKWTAESEKQYISQALYLISVHCSILNKSENATPELFATYIQNYANQKCN